MTTTAAAFPCSIIVPLYNQAQVTARCLAQLAAHTPADLYEVVLVDNGSTDGTPDVLAGVSGDVTIIRNSVNEGFARACNAGARAASSDLLLFLNNDTEPQPGWLEPMLSVMASEPGVGAVGSRLLFPDGTLQHAGMWVVEDRLRGIPLVGVHRWVHEPADYALALVTAHVRALTGACLMVRREAFEALGGFDEGYWNGCEDLDLCFALGAAGWRLVYEPTSCLIHHEGGSGPERWRSIGPNVRRLAERWAGRVAPDVVVDESGAADAASTRSRAAEPVLHVLYRYSEEPPGRPSRPPFFDKDVALASFIHAVSRAADPVAVTFVTDGWVNPATRATMERHGPVVTMTKRGNAGSYRALLEAVQESGWADEAVVYFAEDDYLYVPDAFRRLLLALRSFPHAEYFTLYDHPDRYTRADDADTGRVDLYLAPPGQHWRTTESTCMTFAARVGALRRDLEAQLGGLDQEIPMDRGIWRRTLFELPRLRGPGATRPVLLSPVPSLATHCHTDFLAPGVDWPAEAAASRRHGAAPPCGPGALGRPGALGGPDRCAVEDAVRTAEYLRGVDRRLAGDDALVGAP